LVDIVEQERELLNPFTADGKRKKALVPVRRSSLVHDEA
jgi:hypothetical protein